MQKYKNTFQPFIKGEKFWRHVDQVFYFLDDSSSNRSF